MLKVGLIGCGAIGSYVAKAIDDGLVEVKLITVFDKDVSKAEALVRTLKRVKPKVARSIRDVLEESLDLVIEAASPEAVRSYIVELLQSGKSVIVLSSGALLDENLFRRIIEAARGSGAKVYVPSGAIGGLDALKAASLIGVEDVVLTTRKHPRALGINGISEAVVVFEGDAEEAVKRFPLNVNVAATLALVTGKRPRVRVIADPHVSENVHEIAAKGAFGEIKIEMRNKRMEENPKTSVIAALSVLQLLKQLSGDAVTLGT